MSATPERKAGQQALLHFLQRQGRLSSEQAAQVEKLAAEGSTTVQEALDRAGVISEKDLAQFLAATLGLRAIDLTTFPLDPQTARELKETVATRYGVLPLRVDERTMDIATANPLDLEALKAVEFATGKRVRALVATQVEIRDAMGHAYNLQGSLEQFLQHVPENESLTVAELRDEHGDLRTIAHDAELPPVIRLADLMLIEAIKSRSSDVHVEPALDTVLVRYRVDGILEEAFRFPKWVQNPLIARLKIMAKLDITERRVPQDGRIRLRYSDKHVDLRVSSLPSQHGEKITLRILDAGTSLQALDRIGLNQKHLPLMREAIRRPQGMVLITGPTGSGKTTTLYAVLREIYSTNISVVTIEDPIEYQLKGINQVEVNDKQGRTFAGVLRSVLRQDPDVILIGEIRDRETAQIAFQAAQTGHLVLTTVHTNDAAGAVTRLIDLGLDPRAVASTVNIVVAQRLVRRICTSCGAPDTVPDDVRHALRLPPDLTGAMRGTGCAQCRQSGYVGRTGVYEVFPITPTIAKLLETGGGETAVRQQARSEGFPGMLEDATEKLKTGITTAEELLRVVYVKEDAPRCPGCRKEVSEDYSVCPHCSRVLRATCSGCNKPLTSGWSACPYCGTSATVVSPRSTAAVPAGAPAVSPAPEAASRTFRALVVDDTEHIREIVRVALERSDLQLQVVTAASGEEALAAAMRDRPDIVVLDISMPDMDGFEVCRRLRTEVRTAFVPVLLLTAHDSEDFIERGFGVGADDYMIKPFRRDDLIARLRRMLQRTYGSGVAPDLSESPPAPAEVTAPPALAPIDTAALDRLSAEVAGIAGTQGALLERLESCERLVAESAAGHGSDAGAPRAEDSEESRASLDEIRQLVAAARSEQVKTLTALAARIDAVETKAPKGGGKADSATVARLVALDEAVERIESEQSELATALAARSGTEEAQNEACERRLAVLTTRLDTVEAQGVKGGKTSGETAERLVALQEAIARLGTEHSDLSQALAARAGTEDAQDGECERRLAMLTARLEVVEAEEITVAKSASETAEVLAALQQGLADVRAAHASSGEQVVSPLRDAVARITTQQTELATRLDEVQATGSAEGQIASEAAERVADLQAALAELRAAQASASEGLRDAQVRFDEFSARIDAHDPERAHLREMVDQGEARLAELTTRLQGESARLDMLLSLVDGCETQLTDFAGRLEKDLLRRDTLMALVDGCEAQLTELAARLTGRSAGQGAPAGMPTIDLHQRLKALNAMLAERTGEGEQPDPGTALRVRTEIFGQLRRQLDELRAGAPWPAAARKTLALLVDSTLAATIVPVVRGALQATGMSSFFESSAADEPAQEQREEARPYYDDPS